MHRAAALLLLAACATAQHPSVPFEDRTAEIYACYTARIGSPAKPSRTQYSGIELSIAITGTMNLNVEDATGMMAVSVPMVVFMLWEEPELFKPDFDCANAFIPELRSLSANGMLAPMDVSHYTFSLLQPAGAYTEGRHVQATFNTLYNQRLSWTFFYFPFDRQSMDITLVMLNGFYSDDALHGNEILNCNKGPRWPINSVDAKALVESGSREYPFSLHMTYNATPGPVWFFDPVRDVTILPAEIQRINSEGGFGERPEWMLQPGGYEDAIEVEAGLVSTSFAKCTLTLKVERDVTTYLLKQFVMDVLVVFAGLLALFLDPNIPPLLGGRCGVLITGMLITMNRLSGTKLGLGAVNYLICIDYFSICNLGILVGALSSTMTVHLLYRQQSLFLAKQLDAFLPAAFFILYALIVFFFLLFLAINPMAKAGIIAYWLIATVFYLIGMAGRLYMPYRRRRRAIDVGVRLVFAQPADESYAALQALFGAFDRDSSGSLEQPEVRELLKAMYPKATPQNLRDLLRHTKLDQDDEITLDELYDALLQRERFEELLKSQGTDDKLAADRNTRRGPGGALSGMFRRRGPSRAVGPADV